MNNSAPKTLAQNVKVFLGGLPKKTKDSTLQNHLSRYGNIFALSTKRKRTDGECLGYGEATVDQKTYDHLILIGSSKFMGRRITFGPYLDGSQLKSHLEKLNSKRIFVRNIPKNSTPKSLEQLFNSIGKVETAYLRNVPGSRKPIGVILFNTPEQAESSAKFINKDVEGVFRKMNATYKFVTNFKKKTKKQRHQNEAANHANARPSFKAMLLRRDDIRPGSSSYRAYRTVQMNHGFSNLVLNKNGKKSKAISEEPASCRKGSDILKRKKDSFEITWSDSSSNDYQSFDQERPRFNRPQHAYPARLPPQRQRHSFFVPNRAWNNEGHSLRF